MNGDCVPLLCSLKPTTGPQSSSDLADGPLTSAHLRETPDYPHHQGLWLLLPELISHHGPSPPVQGSPRRSSGLEKGAGSLRTYLGASGFVPSQDNSSPA